MAQYVLSIKKIMIVQLISTISLLSLLSGQSPDSPSALKTIHAKTVSVHNKGWHRLFDGKSTRGWHTYGKTEAGKAWKVDEGSLYLDVTNKNSEQRGDLVTDEEFENFHLKLDWKISEGSNSGIIFNIKEDPGKYKNTYNTGPEMQVIDNEKHRDAKNPKHRAADLYDLVACSKETGKPIGEWNTVEIVSNKGKLDFYLNGVNVVSTTMFDDNWNQLIAGSKFAGMPGFGTFRSGKIALQDHGDQVWYRNILIKKL
jgi:hypothetical protein